MKTTNDDLGCGCFIIVGILILLLVQAVKLRHELRTMRQLESELKAVKELATPPPHESSP